MNHRNPLRHYHDNEISTSNQGRLILMMYDGALQAVRRAMECMDQNDLAGKGQHILKAQDIVNELSLALDMKEGGSVAQTLDQLYQFVLNQLLQANISHEKIYLESIVKVLTPLQEAWKQLVKAPTVPEEPAAMEAPLTRFTVKC